MKMTINCHKDIDGGEPYTKIVDSITLELSPVEYLVASAALKQFIEDHDNHITDIKVAKQMREVMENVRQDGPTGS